MSITIAPTEQFRPSPYPGVRFIYNPLTRRVRYLRRCDRCPTERIVRRPCESKNLCRDCISSLTAAELLRWAA